jgi:putative ABC transport system substrate-binding protein
MSGMGRREFVALLGGAAAWPLAVRAQQPAMPVVGFVSGRSLASDSDLVAVFLRALNEAGYVNGQNVAIEFRWADGQLDRLPEFVADLVERKVVVIFGGASDVAAGALRVAAATVPVVFATGSDPVAARLVASLNRPGGNLTGVTVLTNALWPKRLELVRELISQTPLIAFLVNWNNVNHAPAMRELSAAARGLGQEVMVLNATA